MNYLNISFTHKNTDITIRERLSFSDDDKKNKALKMICSSQSILECMILSTCNRVEIIAFVNNLEISQSYILKAISILSGVALSELEHRVDVYYASGAIHHLFAVASSLDSLVVGETQIVSQLKTCFKFALNSGYAKINLKRAVEYSLKCAAEVRNKTEISKNPVSISSVAVSKAKEIFKSLNKTTAVVVGAGDMSELACKHLLSNGSNVILVNRSQDRAMKLISSLCSDRVKFEPFLNLKELINSHQIIFCATSANVIINDEMLQDCEFDRYFFDIAVPRNIDITENVKIKIYSVDDLQEIVKLNLAMREEQAQIAYAIIGRNVGEFFKWLKILSTTPIIKALRGLAKDISDIEIQKAIKKGYLKNSDKDEARRLIHQVFKAFLHKPTINLKNLEEDINLAFNTILQIFDIEDKFEKYSKELENMGILDEI
ncbi:glutamyl-tRNA reductase [Campylobacter sp. FMV-PI01]|uniref:Glutamyl-tRNA reductase n=1 Tax=Campylobacter portucalensis TaxID=2608384 RepID=A0A6L5WG99_9BACT|nr:glutamyl-tRNA reductase [Campylobacter portucalensis]MSN95979.1 glutamyl-tRNA reductase [Campylobacter portucalensis]